MNKPQSGFAAIELLLTLILVAIVSFTGYFVWHSQQETSKTLDVANNTAQTVAPKKNSITSPKYLTINEWGVKIPLSSDLSDAYYTTSPNVSNAVYLSLNSYKDTDCAASRISLGAVARFTANDKDDGGATLLSDFPSASKVGNYYYQYQHPQSACSGSTTVPGEFDQQGTDKASNLMNMYKDAAAHIVAIN